MTKDIWNIDSKHSTMITLTDERLGNIEPIRVIFQSKNTSHLYSHIEDTNTEDTYSSTISYAFLNDMQYYILDDIKGIIGTFDMFLHPELNAAIISNSKDCIYINVRN